MACFAILVSRYCGKVHVTSIKLISSNAALEHALISTLSFICLVAKHPPIQNVRKAVQRLANFVDHITVIFQDPLQDPAK